jgi:hypothetical protein
MRDIMYKEYENILSDEVYEYLRKSRSDDPLLSVEEVLAKHETMLNEYAEKYLGGRVPSAQIIREVASSETIDDRPGMVKLLKIIESPKVKAVLVIEPQRLSRGDLEDAGRIIKLFRYTNTLIITPVKTYDLRDEYDRDAFERELKRGNEYLEYAKKIMNRGRLQSVKDGNYIGSIAPYGYRKIAYKEGKHKCHTLEIIPEQAEAVRMIFDLYVNKGYGYSKIAQTLNELGYKPAKDDRWKIPSVSDITRNEVYIGKIRWNYRKSILSVEEQEIIKSRPRNDNNYLLFDGKQPPIISEELFYKAQERHSNNPPVTSDKELVNALAGLCYCGKCGSFMRYRKGNKSSPLPRIECGDITVCQSGSAFYDEVIGRIIDTLEQCIDDFEVKIKDSDNTDELKDHQRLIDSLEKRYKDLEAKEMAQWESQSHPDESQRMPPHIFKQLNEKLLKEKDEVREALCEARNTTPRKIDYESQILSFKTAVDALRDEDVSVELKNKYLKEIIERITYTREKSISLTKEKAEELGIDKNPSSRWHAFPFYLDVILKV